MSSQNVQMANGSRCMLHNRCEVSQFSVADLRNHISFNFCGGTQAGKGGDFLNDEEWFVHFWQVLLSMVRDLKVPASQRNNARNRHFIVHVSDDCSSCVV